MLNKFTSVWILFFIFCSHFVFAQDKAVYREKFTEGNYLILEENYGQALKNFLEAYAIDSSNANINYKVGFCYLKSASEKSKATHFLEKACLNVTNNYSDLEPREKKAPENAYYYLAQAYHLDYRFDESIDYFNKFKTRVGPKNKDLIADINHRIEVSTNAKEFYSAPTRVDIINLGDSINTKYPEYSPVVTADENMLLFTSRRPGGTGGETGLDGQYFEDIYVAYRKKDGTWGMPHSIGPEVNTASNEASISLTPDGQQLFIYKDDNGGDIFMTHLEGDNWTKAEPLTGDINSKSWETHACITADGNTLYFVSDRAGGFGGRDIYKCVKLPNGKWSKASNLGPKINTQYDEDSPFIHPNKVDLFFSSRGHKTMGGFDIFFSTLNPDSNTWSEPMNIGYPINTTDDDVFYVTTPDGKRAYYSSARPGGYGDKDIYLIKIPEPPVEKPVALLKGFITTADGSELPSDIVINVTDKITGEQVSTTKPIRRTGSYSIILEPGRTYIISYLVGGKEVASETVDVPAGSQYTEINKPLLLNNLTLTGTSVAINKIGEKETPDKDPKVKDPKIKEPKIKEPKIKEPKIKTPKDIVHADKESNGPKTRVTYYGGREFRLYFAYDVHNIEVTDADFVKFMDTLSAVVKSKGAIQLFITGSASQVPTHAYKNNHFLGLQRAMDAKEVMIKALKERGVDESKVEIVKLKGEVNGPAYKTDAQSNQTMYKKFQFVKVKFALK